SLIISLNLLLSSRYDFIFIGAGCAGLSLVMRMIRSGRFADKKILLIDKEPKTKNDRTWCFWEKQDGFFENIVYKKWTKLSFLSDEFSDVMDISPYQYKMIRGIDFYRYCFDEISKHPNVDVLYADIKSISFEDKTLSLRSTDRSYDLYSDVVFNSLSFPGNNKPAANIIDLLQHFKGWIIETPTAVFDPAIATFMDFRVPQSRGTTFAYVLPFSETRAMVEFTLFTKQVLTDEEYNKALGSYLDEVLKVKEYKVMEEEFGVILMTTRKFDFWSGNAFNIGVAGGQTKASSGYTFQFIQKQSEAITKCLIDNKDLHGAVDSSSRFRFYDRVLLDVLDKNRLSGKKVFSTLFKENKAQQVLKFLDNESTFAEELKIISTLPAIPFLKAAFNQF
ncbi:MAG TPA: lycopene cyclase family protein, partial [Chitinophagaceae bacterium]|nr:lycopene cyclase family protein [Chitinophagaceae bacterium]